MNNILCKITKLQIFFENPKDRKNTFSFGSVPAAEDYINTLLESEDSHHIESYVIEEETYVPSDINNPAGRLNIHSTFFKYVNIKELRRNNKANIANAQ